MNKNIVIRLREESMRQRGGGSTGSILLEASEYIVQLRKQLEELADEIRERDEVIQSLIKNSRLHSEFQKLSSEVQKLKKALAENGEVAA